MNEIEAWIAEEDKKLEGSNTIICLEFDNGESYSDHYTYPGKYWFRSIKETFDFMIANTDFKPTLQSKFFNKGKELIFVEIDCDEYDPAQYATLVYLKEWK